MNTTPFFPLEPRLARTAEPVHAAAESDVAGKWKTRRAQLPNVYCFLALDCVYVVHTSRAPRALYYHTGSTSRARRQRLSSLELWSSIRTFRGKGFWYKRVRRELGIARPNFVQARGDCCCPDHVLTSQGHVEFNLPISFSSRTATTPKMCGQPIVSMVLFLAETNYLNRVLYSARCSVVLLKKDWRWMR